MTITKKKKSTEFYTKQQKFIEILVEDKETKISLNSICFDNHIYVNFYSFCKYLNITDDYYEKFKLNSKTVLYKGSKDSKYFKYTEISIALKFLRGDTQGKKVLSKIIYLLNSYLLGKVVVPEDDGIDFQYISNYLLFDFKDKDIYTYLFEKGLLNKIESKNKIIYEPSPKVIHWFDVSKGFLNINDYGFKQLYTLLVNDEIPLKQKLVSEYYNIEENSFLITEYSIFDNKLTLTKKK